VRLDRSDNRNPWTFFLLVFALSLPLYILTPFVSIPGLPKNAPALDFVGALMPMTAALILSFRARGWGGVRALLSRAVDFGRMPRRRWFVPVLLVMPAIYLVTGVLMWLTGIEAHRQPVLSPLTMAIFLPIFLIAATGEELGWTGYATEPLWARFGPLGASVIIGLPWWLWHLPSIIRSGQTPMLIFIGFFATFGFRVIYVWIYGNTGSVGAVIIIHAVTNVSASYFPTVPTSAAGPVLVLVAVLIAVEWFTHRRSDGRRLIAS
jgi:membrane protease YdiL (CAAX protease family)